MVSVSSGNASKATAAPSLLSFTTVNWNTYQTVTVNGVNDANTSNESVNIASSLGFTSRSVTVTVTDDD